MGFKRGPFEMTLVKNLSLLSLLIFVTSFHLHGNDGILFHNSFDHYSIHAEKALGQRLGVGLGNGDLQLRMFPGINNQGNAVVLAENEHCEYNMKGNFNPDGGTVSLWVAARDWKPSDQRFHVFFEAVDKNFRLIIYKFKYANTFFFYLQSPAITSKDNTATAAAWIDDSTFGIDVWHKIDAVWDSSGMKLFIDGVLPAMKEWRKPEVTFPQPVKFTSKQTQGKGMLILGMSSKIWSVKDDCHTAFDNLTIYNRPLSATEIISEYEKIKPITFGNNRKRNL